MYEENELINVLASIKSIFLRTVFHFWSKRHVNYNLLDLGVFLTLFSSIHILMFLDKC